MDVSTINPKTHVSFIHNVHAQHPFCTPAPHSSVSHASYIEKVQLEPLACCLPHVAHRKSESLLPHPYIRTVGRIESASMLQTIQYTH